MIKAWIVLTSIVVIYSIVAGHIIADLVAAHVETLLEGMGK